MKEKQDKIRREMTRLAVSSNGWLHNIPIIRIKESEKGFSVESLHRKWYGKTYWKPVINYTGFKEHPYYYRNFKIALSECVKYFEWDLIKNSNHER